MKNLYKIRLDNFDSFNRIFFAGVITFFYRVKEMNMNEVVLSIGSFELNDIIDEIKRNIFQIKIEKLNA